MNDIQQDGRQNGRHLPVCTCGHSTLVIHHPIASKFHIRITFIKLLCKFEYELFSITKMAATCQFALVDTLPWSLIHPIESKFYIQVTFIKLSIRGFKYGLCLITKMAAKNGHHLLVCTGHLHLTLFFSHLSPDIFQISYSGLLSSN